MHPVSRRGRGLGHGTDPEFLDLGLRILFHLRFRRCRRLCRPRVGRRCSARSPFPPAWLTGPGRSRRTMSPGRPGIPPRPSRICAACSTTHCQSPAASRPIASRWPLEAATADSSSPTLPLDDSTESRTSSRSSPAGVASTSARIASASPKSASVPRPPPADAIHAHWTSMCRRSWWWNASPMSNSARRRIARGPGP